MFRSGVDPYKTGYNYKEFHPAVDHCHECRQDTCAYFFASFSDAVFKVHFWNKTVVKRRKNHMDTMRLANGKLLIEAALCFG
jgi:hypothetical protein